MARGTQFRELINMFRAELGQSLQRSTGINSLEAQKYALRNTYQWLYDAFDWQFLKVYREESLAAGEDVYSFDEALAYENVEKVWCTAGSSWEPVEFGIQPEHRARYPDGVRGDRVRRWDAYEDNQYIVLPVPAVPSKLRMYGVRTFKPLVNESDACLLDDLLVVWWTVARVAPKSKSGNGQLYVELAKDRMRRLKAKSRANKSKPFVLGGGGFAGHGPALRPGIDYIPE